MGRARRKQVFATEPTEVLFLDKSTCPGCKHMVTTATPAEQRVILQNISWQTFKTMLAEMGSEQHGSRLAYDSLLRPSREILNKLGE